MRTDALPIAGPYYARVHLTLNADLRAVFNGPDAFDRIMRLDGEVFRHHKHRRTARVEIAGRPYFLKIHRRPGWGEIIKNVARGRIPVTTARPEVAAIRRCVELGIATTPIAGWGLRGRNPATAESFLLTEALPDMLHLDERAHDWGGLTGARRVRLQRAVITAVARIARTIHRNGMNHRDFYLCHFMLPRRDWSQWTADQPLDLHLIDLHRTQIRRRTPWWWMTKDLSGLLFSALDAGFTTRDYLRFLRVYEDRPWRDTLRRRRLTLAVIRWRAARVYQSEHGRPAPPPAGRASSS